MICKNCGKEFEGKFCPECGTGVGEEKRKLSAKKFLGVFAKIYRWLLAGGMLLVGIVSLLCLTAPTITENFLGEVNKLCTGFAAISGKDVDVSKDVVNASVILLAVSLIALVYGGAQLFIAFKKPYSNTVGKKRFVFWGIDGVISLILIISGAVVAKQAGAEDLEGGRVGAGFAMAIVMGVFGLLFLGARIFYEFKLFKWEDTQLSEDQIAKVIEKKELSDEQIIIRKMSLIWIVILLLLIAFILMLCK